jgi:NitT/TauT family transport system permease protein
MKALALAAEVLFGLVPIALLLAVWQGLVSFGYAPTTLLPPPGLVFQRLVQQLTMITFQQEIAATLFRLFAGFAIAVVLGVSLGLAAAASPPVSAVLRPIVRVLAPLPKVALYPALLLLLGFSHGSKITLVAADALFPILLSTYYGASIVEQKLIWSAMAAGTPRSQMLFKVILPATMPSILTGCRIGLVISCIVVFLAEMITSTDGLGHLLVTAARTFQAVDMFVPLITISLLGLILNGLGAILSAAGLSAGLMGCLRLDCRHDMDARPYAPGCSAAVEKMFAPLPLFFDLHDTQFA